jgi:hypothetical protein
MRDDHHNGGADDGDGADLVEERGDDSGDAIAIALGEGREQS